MQYGRDNSELAATLFTNSIRTIWNLAKRAEAWKQGQVAKWGLEYATHNVGRDDTQIKFICTQLARVYAALLELGPSSSVLSIYVTSFLGFSTISESHLA